MFEVGDVVKSTSVTFNMDYGNATGVVLEVLKESNGTFLKIEWTTELDSMRKRCREVAYKNGAGGLFHSFTVHHVAARTIEELTSS